MADIGFNVGFEAAKKTFFDKPAVEDAVDKAGRDRLSKFGAYTRRNVKGSLKSPRRIQISEMSDEQRKKFKTLRAIVLWHRGVTIKPGFAASRPGEPPRNITGRIREFVFFSYDDSARSVVIGPTLLNDPTGAPQKLEEGGETEVSAGPDRGKIIFIKPRPYMRPGFEKAYDDLHDLFKNSVSN